MPTVFITKTLVIQRVARLQTSPSSNNVGKLPRLVERPPNFVALPRLAVYDVVHPTLRVFGGTYQCFTSS
jgi:hypothetical protein